MKQVLIVLTMLLTLGMSVPTMAQKHRHTPQGTELVDTTRNGSAVDAFSDTTTVDSSSTTHYSFEWDSDNDEDVDKAFEAMGQAFDKMNNSGLAWLAWVFVILVIIFVFLLVLSPFIFCILIIWLVSRNRKQKVQMAQMAMQNGQPIPEQLLESPKEEISDEYQKGLRQCFVGVGLAIFLGIAAKEIGFGIGALVFCIGLGKIIAAKTASKKNDLNDNNNLTHQDYD
ncbi:MAG: hypothetical protein J6I37_06795 [Prevotella sp.]|nr:hypothetical protein [Prevotella sp.]